MSIPPLCWHCLGDVLWPENYRLTGFALTKDGAEVRTFRLQDIPRLVDEEYVFHTEAGTVLPMRAATIVNGTASCTLHAFRT